MVILRVEIFIGRSLWFFLIKYLLENIVKILYSYRWLIIKFVKGYYWFISDNFVIKLNYMDRNNYDFLGGWGKEKGNIIFLFGLEYVMFV